MRAWLAGRGNRRHAMAALVVLLVLFMAGLVGVSPAALALFQGDTATWERLSLIGQTYGAASALLSALALVGIAITLVLQAREVKVSREQGQRILHVDLLKMAMDNPLYRRAWGPVLGDGEEDRQHLYVNLIVSEWQVSFEIGTMGEALLRAEAASLFRGEPGRRFWRNARQVRLATSSARRERRFHQILDEEYRKAEAEGPPVPDRSDRPPARPSYSAYRMAAVGVAVGVCVTVLIQRMRRMSGKGPRRP